MYDRWPRLGYDGRRGIVGNKKWSAFDNSGGVALMMVAYALRGDGAGGFPTWTSAAQLPCCQPRNGPAEPPPECVRAG